jgi:S-DNA-T family DNA segregation ATPase FtsK/SpoIIIE
MILSMLIATDFLILPLVVSSAGYIRKFYGKLREMMPSGLSFNIRLPRKQTGTGKMAKAKEEISKKLTDMRKQVEEARKVSFRGDEDSKGASISSSVKTSPDIVKKAPKKKVSPRPKKAVPVFSDEEGRQIDYKMPEAGIFSHSPQSDSSGKKADLKKKAELLERTLLEFGVEARVVKINTGPVITMYELEPAIGTRVNKVTSLSDNISLALRSANIRILAPIPGKGTIGIEVPNEKSELVCLRDILEAEEYTTEESPLKFALGKDVAGDPIVPDLAGMPHLLIAGATGSGKTVCINAVISSYLYNSSPEEIKFLMIDPKRVELMMYEGIPHLIAPIVTNPKKAAGALNWVVNEMERRYKVFAESGVRNISTYKQRTSDKDENLPYIVVIVDELADLMMVAQQDVEAAIMRIAQLARAAGIHLILATQRPSVNVITGVIKANFPARISFKVASKVDSRTVLDTNGAEKLLGKGDMLLMEPGSPDVIRGQCSYVDDREIKELVRFIKDQAPAQYNDEVIARAEKKLDASSSEEDEIFWDAVEMVVETKQASVSMIQRKFRVGYTRAARLIDIMEEKGIVGPYNGSKPRELLVESMDQFQHNPE